MPLLENTQIVDLGRNVWFENLEADVGKLLESHEEELNPKELVELTEQKEEEAAGKEEVIAPNKELTAKWLAT